MTQKQKKILLYVMYNNYFFYNLYMDYIIPIKILIKLSISHI